MPRVINFEGRRIQVPDDATDAEVTEILSAQPTAAQASAAPQQVAPPAEPSLTDTIMGGLDYAGGVVDQAGRGFAEGVTNILGMPQALMAGKNDIMSAGLAKLGVPPEMAEFIGHLDPSEHLLPSAESMQAAGDSMNNAIADRIGVERPRTEPENLPERFANRVGEEVGAMAVPATGAISRAQHLRRTHGHKAPQIAREGGVLSRMLVEPATVNPKRFLRNETTIAAGAGVGAAGANELAPDNPYADVGGALLGAGATGVGGGLLRSGNEMLRAIFGANTYVDDVVRDAVTDRVAGAAQIPALSGQPVDTTDLVETIMEGPRISETIPGVTESLADRTQNPGIASLEYSRQSGPNSGVFNTRRQQNARAIDEAITANEPQGSSADLRSELELERGRQLTNAETEALNAQEAAERATTPLTPITTPSARGNTVRSALEDAREAARARTDEAYSAVGVEDRQIQPEALVDEIEGAVSRMTQAEQSLLPEALIARIRGLGGGQAVLKEATDLRSELLRLQRAASADPRAERGGRNAARVLGGLAETVDGFISRNISPEERTALETARGAKFDEAERFTRQGDPVASALARNEGGLPRTRDERVAGSFTEPQAMDLLFAQADTPEVRTAIREEILAGADLTRADRIQQFIRQNGERLDRFPGLRDELEQAARARGDQTAAASRRADLERNLGTDDRTGKSTVGKFLSFSNANSDKAIREVLSAKDPAKAADELLTFVGDDPAAVNGARKALWGNMAKASKRAGETTQDITGAQQWMPAALKRWLDDPRNSAVAKRFYQDNPEHIENLHIIADALQGLDVRNTARVPNASGTAQATIPSTETLGSMALAYKRGQIGPAFIATRLGAVFARRSVRNARSGAIERMLDDVLLNPDDAALLLRENNPANRAALKRKAKLWFGNEASTIMNELSADDVDDDLGAIMRDEFASDDEVRSAIAR